MSAGQNRVEKPVSTFNVLGLLIFFFWSVVSTLFAVWLLRPESGAIVPSFAIRAAVAAMFALFAGMWAYRRITSSAEWAVRDTHVTTPQEFEAAGVGRIPSEITPENLYLDLMKRTIINIIYEDRPYIFYNDKNQYESTHRYRLDRRILGEDIPIMAHSMVGLHRLTNLQQCVQQLLSDNVPGDLLEAGVLRGGASIFMRAVLKAHKSTDRRVIACDTFRAREAPKPTLVLDLIVTILSLLSYIPSPRMHRAIVMFLHRSLKSEMRSFPVTDDPSPELIEFTMFHMRVAKRAMMAVQKDQTGIEAVRSHFAAYGLLDDQVTFLQGFFSDTLSTAPIEKLALIRLDGDTYESTLDILNPLYPKLSAGGYCIIDDYHAFPDCSRAVNEYREKHGITAEMHRIDNIAVYWRKS